MMAHGSRCLSASATPPRPDRSLGFSRAEPHPQASTTSLATHNASNIAIAEPEIVDQRGVLQNVARRPVEKARMVCVSTSSPPPLACAHACRRSPTIFCAAHKLGDWGAGELIRGTEMCSASTSASCFPIYPNLQEKKETLELVPFFSLLDHPPP